MKIGFYSNQLGVRGTEVALYDYAIYNRSLLNNESITIHNTKFSSPCPLTYEKFSKEFPVFFVQTIEDINRIIKQEKLDLLYMIKAGVLDEFITNECKTGVHAVFKHYEPHGTVYSYVSEWLSNTISREYNTKTTFVPHIINLPEPTEDFRNKLNIPKNAIVFGRHGGFDQFNINFVKSAIVKYLDKNQNCYFLFLNTEKFINHPRVIHLDPIADLQEKSNFINTCDAMIHAQYMGETFGIAICEFLFHNKPVFSFAGGWGQNHLMILNNTNSLYSSEIDLINKFDMLENGYYKDINWKNLVKKFSPELVMDKFKSIFIEG